MRSILLRLEEDRQKIKILNRLVSFYGFQHWWEDENRISDWVSIILIQQTTEMNAKKALDRLHNHLSVTKLMQLDELVLQDLIRPAGFFKQKSKYIKELIDWFHSYGSDLSAFHHYSTEEIRKELLSIRGVGPETADVMLLYIFERKVFIADQYAIRLFNRLGMGNYKSYEDMQKSFNHLVKDIPYDLCKEWHAAIDTHGKAYNKNKEMDESWLLSNL